MRQLKLGDAFIVPTPPNSQHLYVIIANISEKNYLLVSVTTSNTQIIPDQDCVINPGKDTPPFITRQSTIAYRHARNARDNDIERFLKNGKWVHNGKFSERYVYEMQLKGASSKKIKRKYKKVLQEILHNQEFYEMFG